MQGFQAWLRANATNAGPVNWDPNNPNHQDVRPGSLGVMEARDVYAPLKPPTQRIVEVRDAGRMGHGLFAKQNIPRGARILAELPLFTMPLEKPITDVDSLYLVSDHKDMEDFIEQVDLVKLDSQNIKTMETLYCNEEEARDQDITHAIKNFIFRQIRIQWAIDCAKVGPERPPIPARLLERLRSPNIDRYARLWAIWNNNRVKLGQGASRDSGVFLLASRINHSCCPNAWYDFNPHVGHKLSTRVEMLTTHAIRNITAGEQIFVGYDAMSLTPRHERVAQLATWDVPNCVCALCTNPVVEALQQRACRLWPAIGTCQDAFKALKLAEEVVALITHPMWNVRDGTLADAFQVCSIACERIATNPKLGLSYDEAVGYWTKSMRFAMESSQVHMMLVGTDGRDMRMADHRFRELQHRRERWIALQNGWPMPPPLGRS